MLDAEVRHQRYAMIAAVCATAVLGIALFNRISDTGPCTYNSFQRSAVCVKISTLPGTIPQNAQILHWKNEDELLEENSPLQVLLFLSSINVRISGVAKIWYARISVSEKVKVYRVVVHKISRCSL